MQGSTPSTLNLAMHLVTFIDVDPTSYSDDEYADTVNEVIMEPHRPAFLAFMRQLKAQSGYLALSDTPRLARCDLTGEITRCYTGVIKQHESAPERADRIAACADRLLGYPSHLDSTLTPVELYREGLMKISPGALKRGLTDVQVLTEVVSVLDLAANEPHTWGVFTPQGDWLEINALIVRCEQTGLIPALYLSQRPDVLRPVTSQQGEARAGFPLALGDDIVKI